MANITGKGAPTKFVEGNVGDIYTNSNNGKTYELESIYTVTGIDGIEVNYVWRPIYEDDSNESTDRIPTKMSQLINDANFVDKDHVKNTIDSALKDINIDDINTETKSPLTLARFFYNHLTNIPESTFEEKAQWLAKYDVFVYQAYLSNDLTMSRNPYAEELRIYQRALEINPDLKVFGYITARGFAFDNDTNQKVGMTEYRTSPSNVDHPIFTKEELYAYMNLMAHCGGTKTNENDEYGNPVLTGGIPLHGVFFDDYSYNFGSSNTELINQGDWESVRAKQNDLIDYAHSLGLSVMANSSPDDIFKYAATTSFFNPNGEYSHMNENDWMCIESYFLRSDNTYALNNDDHAVIYRELYKDIYKSKVLALTYLSSIVVDDVDTAKGQQIASTFATYQALCQGIDSIALHGTSMYMEIPSEFSKYYNSDDSAVYTADVEDGIYTLSVNGHTVTTTRSIAKTAFGQVPNIDTLSSCKVTIDGSHTFINGYLRTEEVLYGLNELESELNKKISEIGTDFTDNSNLYHRAFIDDWDNTYRLSDYTNYATTFKNAFGGEDTGSTSTWDAEHPYDVTIKLPQAWSWRRVIMDVSDFKGKTLEIGFDSCNVYVENDNTQHPNLTWQIVGNCESNSFLTITTFNANGMSTSVDGVNRCCTRFKVPEDIKELIFWCQRTDSKPEGAWIIDAKGLYLIDPSEHTVTKTWFTNYLNPVSNWVALDNYSNYEIEIDDDGNGIMIHYTTTNTIPRIGLSLAADASILLPGETWEWGVEEFYGYDDDGNDVTNQMQIYFNAGTGSNSGIGFNYYGKTSENYESMTSELKEGLICLDKATVPESYIGGLPSTNIYVKPTQNNGGVTRSDGTANLYHLRVRGVYLYNLDERDELLIRGEDPSTTYIKMHRVTSEQLEKDSVLEIDSIYIVDNGRIIVTNRRGDKIVETIALPKDENGNVQYGEAGQVAVSDGNGGITWDTLSN